MYSQRNEIQVLNELGLTGLQAKLYVQLAMTGRQKATELSNLTNTDKSSTYQSLKQLEKIGLVAKILAKPTLYEAIPIEEGITALLEYKKEQYYKVHDKAEKLLRTIPKKNVSQKNEAEEFRLQKFVKETALEKIAQSTNVVQKSFDILLNDHVFLDSLINMPEPHIKCMKRGIKYRVIVEKTNWKPIWNSLQKLIAQPNFQIRYILNPPPIVFIITDEMYVGVPLSANKVLGEGIDLQFRHPGCREVFQFYFDSLWNQANKI